MNIEPPTEPKTVHVSLKIGAAQLSAWKQAAGKVPLSVWLRDAADAAVKQQNERQNEYKTLERA